MATTKKTRSVSKKLQTQIVTQMLTLATNGFGRFYHPLTLHPQRKPLLTFFPII